MTRWGVRNTCDQILQTFFLEQFFFDWKNICVQQMITYTLL